MWQHMNGLKYFELKIDVELHKINRALIIS